jgi:sugar transferase (PEP-CTERM/EpsH1 system associated)
MRARDPRRLVAHVVFRFDVGGLENGVVNLINRMPADEFRHVVIALTRSTDFARRIRRDDVEVHALDKQPGKDPAAYLRLYRLLRRLRPDVVHTRNLGTLDCQVVAALARVPLRIHGEHGWDIHDPDGTNRKYRALRRAMNRFVHRFVTVSRDLERYLVETVGIPAAKVQRICNGVDTELFHPLSAPDPGPVAPARVVVGSVTRFEPIKDPLNLVQAFITARRTLSARRGAPDLRLAMLGDGPLREPALEALRAAGEAPHADLPGARADVAASLRQWQLYALGSRREGISNTVLEAMASGLPVVASATGGNLELVDDGVTGKLVPPEDPQAMADALVTYATDVALRQRHAAAARARAEQRYSLAGMIAAYRDLYRAGGPALGVAA